MPLTLAEFVQRWKIAGDQTERQAYQQHFVNLCELLGEPTPVQADPSGESYVFEKRVVKTRSGKGPGDAFGFTDVWKRGHFAWEYKGKLKDLRAAYLQLQEYRVDLLNPPLLVVSDLNIICVHTNFPNTAERVYEFNLDDLKNERATAKSVLPPLDILRAIFGDYNVLRPERTSAQVTEEAAKKFLDLARRLEIEARTEKPTKEQIAHFLMRIIFCLFADSIGLLPKHVFRDLVTNSRFLPTRFRKQLRNLFRAMSEEDEGYFGEHGIRWFNGGLFNDDSTIELNTGDMGILYEAAANLDWAHIEPAIFGTLFERSLDVEKRSLTGAHYTSKDDILLLIEPVVMRPLIARWHDVRAQVEQAIAEERSQAATSSSRQARLRTERRSDELLAAWIRELTSVRVLDPACGSGNFLYMALRRMLDLWKEARDFAVEQQMSIVLPDIVSPEQLFGIETDFYAHELASIVVWIGFLQWKHEHAIQDEAKPILRKLSNIEHADAILRYDAEGKPYEPEWPKADYIVGNPPFLGSRKLRSEAGDKYIDDLFSLYKSRVSQEADLVIYWFEKARAIAEVSQHTRIGLLATQAIRQGGSRLTLQKILDTTTLFYAWSNRKWTLNGAAVRVAMVGFGQRVDDFVELDGIRVQQVHADLTSGQNLTEAQSLRENAHLAFQGPVKVGKFELDAATADAMLRMPPNPNGKSNSDVIRPWIIANDITKRPRMMKIIDFGATLSESEAALYEAPFEYVRKHVLPKREKNKRARRRKYWWRHGETNIGMNRATSLLKRYIATPRVSTHRLFVWQDVHTLPDSRVVIIASQAKYMLGVLHSKAHETWSLATSSRHGDGDDGGRITYNIESCFDTFPFPWSPGKEPQDDPRVQAIASAAKNLVDLRDRWLNPPDTPESELAKRTLTNLYNARPQWLQDAHRELDRAVFAAYGWPDDLTDQQILERLLTLNHERAALQEAKSI